MTNYSTLSHTSEEVTIEVVRDIMDKVPCMRLCYLGSYRYAEATAQKTFIAYGQRLVSRVYKQY